jgi:hypothetical protein
MVLEKGLFFISLESQLNLVNNNIITVLVNEAEFGSL